MNTQFWVVQAFNGVSYGALLFLIGSGLSLIFGVMRIVNLSHGAYFLWGGYIALSVIHLTGSTEMAKFLMKLDPKLAILLIEHDMDVVFDVASQISVLHFGQILKTGTPKQINDSAKVQEIYLGVD